MLTLLVTITLAFATLFAVATALRVLGNLLVGDFRAAIDSLKPKNILGGNLSSISSFKVKRYARYRYSTDLETREAVRRDVRGDH